jgi:DNA-binding NarL/FixJ family response regulator
MNPSVSILIIDNNLCFTKAISEFIFEHSAGQIHVMAVARTGEEGIRLTQQLRPQVVLVDLKLSDTFSLLLIPLLRAVSYRGMIITTSQLSAEIYHQDWEIYDRESQKAGANLFIPKYRLEQDLVQVVLDMEDSNFLHSFDPDVF